MENEHDSLALRAVVAADHPDMMLFYQDRIRNSHACILFPAVCEETIEFVRSISKSLEYLTNTEQILWADAEAAKDTREVLDAKLDQLRKSVNSRRSLKVRTGVAQSRVTQRLFPLEQLPAILMHCQGRPDHYLSQNSFKFLRKGLFRSVASVNQLTNCWVDLDYYKIADSELRRHLDDDNEAVASILDLCVSSGMHGRWLIPTLIVRSGRGIYVKWIFGHFLPAAAHPRWHACQVALTEIFRPMGADPAVKDAARVLRIVGSRNGKSDSTVRVLYQRDPLLFDDLASAILQQERLPATDRETVKALTKQYERDVARRKTEGARPVRRTRDWKGMQWPEILATQLPKIIDIFGPGIPMQGRMEGLTFIVMNYRLMSNMVASESDFESQVRQLGNQMGADVELLQQQVKNSWWRHVRGLTPYRFKKEKIRDRLALDTTEHQEIFEQFPWLLDRNSSSTAMPNARLKQRLENRNTAIHLASEGCQLKQIATTVNASTKTVKRWILAHQKAQNASTSDPGSL